MWDAVTVPDRPLKATCTRIVLAARSKVTRTVPVPSEALGGLSLGPLRVAEKSNGRAWALETRPAVATKRTARPIEKAFMRDSLKWLFIPALRMVNAGIVPEG